MMSWQGHSMLRSQPASLILILATLNVLILLQSQPLRAVDESWVLSTASASVGIILRVQQQYS